MIYTPSAAATTFVATVPMLASPSTGTVHDLNRSDWLFDEKLDGIRALACVDERGLTLRSRSGKDITARYPDLELDLPPSYRLGGGIVLDGEIVARDGAFQDIAWRDRQSKPADVIRAMQKVPAKFVAFDVLWLPGMGDIRDQPYANRRSFFMSVERNHAWCISNASPSPDFYEQVRQLGGEGVVAKRRLAPYRGGRSTDWLKFKTTQSVTCVAIGYEPGNGKRANMGAVLLGLVKDRSEIVRVGKVGSGFNVKTADEMRALIDAGKSNALLLPLIEVGCLGKTRNDQLRQPTYKGVRGDLTLLDADHGQLAGLPTT